MLQDVHTHAFPRHLLSIRSPRFPEINLNLLAEESFVLGPLQQQSPMMFFFQTFVYISGLEGRWFLQKESFTASKWLLEGVLQWLGTVLHKHKPTNKFFLSVALLLVYSTQPDSTQCTVQFSKA